MVTLLDIKSTTRSNPLAISPAMKLLTKTKKGVPINRRRSPVVRSSPMNELTLAHRPMATE